MGRAQKGFASGAGLLVLVLACIACRPKATVSSRPQSPVGPGEVRVPAGTFAMGSTDGDSDERPVHDEEVAAFTMDKTETIVADYRRCELAGACTATPEIPYCNEWEKDRDAHPMNCVTFAQASAYCAWAKGRLPTEVEWEYAARGNDHRRYPWGNGAPSAGRLCWDGQRSDLGLGRRRGTCPAGAHPDGASPFGVLDLAGNVWEWTSDRYSRDYASPRSEAKRVVRGGTWYGYEPADVRATLRFRQREDKADYGVGFRCAR